VSPRDARPESKKKSGKDAGREGSSSRRAARPRATAAIKLVAKNKKAYFNYHVLEQVEAGLVLTGSEVKSLREGRLQLLDAYATVERGEVFLVHAHIGEYKNGAYANHAPTRTRKLLLHRREIDRLANKVEERGFTLIPLEVYFKDGRAKVKIGLCKGKAAYDKREAIKERDARRERSREDSTEAG
jgi:SsrA-binding protein